jgi:hypothetical protein
MRHFGTLFNINYLNRGLALLESLKANEKLFELYVLCLDSATYDYLTKNELENVFPLKLSCVENFFPELLHAKANRSLVEYFFTLSPALPLYILMNYNVQQITTLDADIFVYNSLAPVFEEMGSNSIMISPHRFSDKLKYKEIYGLYNVSFQSFRNDDIAIACLKDWLNDCIEWCFDRLEDEKFADQLYLNSWIDKYKKVYVIQYAGAAVAPWNLSDVSLKMMDNKLYIGDEPLLFYHFHGVKFVADNIVLHNLNEYNVEPNNLIVENLYGPYVNKLAKYSLSSNVPHLNIRNKYSGIWIFKRVLKGGALRLKNGSVELMNKTFYKFFKLLAISSLKRT